ncbi:hypothetical protein [Thalassobaculum sp.]|uniref:hypothetical protein n=1 Tax=Thalassobaculum sp. TaxID=2022740 RepID=UPI0032EF5CA3
MTLLTAANPDSTSTGWARVVAKYLGLAASPTFALMAWASASDAAGMAMCSTASAILPIDGMVWMSLLMGIFHLSPWLTLVSGRSREPIKPADRAEGD